MSKLYLVPTPIGNLEDMTFRAIRILKEVDFILAEDTRTSGKLLKHYEIAKQMHSHHMHNEHRIAPADLFSGSQFPCHKLKNVHTWGCPVYVLDTTLQQGKKLPKWQP